MADNLTTKQRLFVEEYLACGFNATEAARRAGYKGNDATLAAVGYENLRKPHIAARIKRRIAESAMTADEVMFRLAEQARASLADCINVDDETGTWTMDLAKAQHQGKLHLIKRLWVDASGNRRIELHDQQAALQLLGRHHGLFEPAEQTINVKLFDVDEWKRRRAERIAQAEALDE
ncbi:MAG: terminase small subunit [Chloroflexi bacterium]|nr:terminase small subunit [Chloroflexota bacterium]